MGLWELAGAARAPRCLRELLRTPWGHLTVVEDSLPMSLPQATIGAVAVLLRARRRTVSGRDGDVEVSRLELAVHALGRCADAAIGEGWATWRLARRVRSVEAVRAAPLPRRAADPKSVLYVRSEPSTTWAGVAIGGAAAHTTGVINGLADYGLEVHVAAADAPRDVAAASMTTIRPTRNHHLVAWLGATNESERIAAAELSRADFVYQRHALGGYAGLQLARRWGVPLVLEYNGSEVWSAQHWSAPRQTLLDLAARLERRILREASLVVVVSTVLQDELLAAGISPNRVLVNPNGVDVAALEAFRADPPAEWRRRLGLPGRPTVGFIGTFAPWHGVTDLPRVAVEVATEMPDARWLLIGDGALHDEVGRDLEARGVAGAVQMTGIVDHQRAMGLLAACDVCVSPHVPNPDGTRFFGSPIKLFEFMGLRKPIVAADLEQIGEVIENNRTGLLVPPRDTAAMAASIVRLLRDPAGADRLAEAALEEVQAHYTWDAHAAKIVAAVAERDPAAAQRARAGSPASQ
jgi:glycosyltransferase involved in cell wall biosynthesis